MSVIINVDHMYCINMDMCWKRWNRMQTRLKNIITKDGESLDRFSAITWADPRIYQQKRRNPKIRTGVYGCAQSHYDLWERIANSNEENLTLILEDDVFFQTDFVNFINDDLASLDAEIKRGPFLYFVNGSGCGDYISFEKTQSSPKVPGLYSSSRATGCIYLTGGYVVNPAACRELIKIYSEGTPSDHITWKYQAQLGGNFENSHSFFHWPWLAVQENEESFIQTESHLKEQVEHNERECLVKYKSLYPEMEMPIVDSILLAAATTLQSLTLVTMFYDLSKIEQNSKQHRKEEYLKWADFILSLGKGSMLSLKRPFPPLAWVV